MDENIYGQTKDEIFNQISTRINKGLTKGDLLYSENIPSNQKYGVYTFITSPLANYEIEQMIYIDEFLKSWMANIVDGYKDGVYDVKKDPLGANQYGLSMTLYQEYLKWRQMKKDYLKNTITEHFKKFKIEKNGRIGFMNRGNFATKEEALEAMQKSLKEHPNESIAIIENGKFVQFNPQADHDYEVTNKELNNLYKTQLMNYSELQNFESELQNFYRLTIEQYGTKVVKTRSTVDGLKNDFDSSKIKQKIDPSLKKYYIPERLMAMKLSEPKSMPEHEKKETEIGDRIEKLEEEVEKIKRVKELVTIRDKLIFESSGGLDMTKSFE